MSRPGGSRSTGVVPKAWHSAVVDDQGRIERIPYELCVLVALRDALRRREVYVDGAKRWRNPEDDLPGDFEDTREVHYAALRQPTDPTEFIAGLRRRMADALARLDRALVDDPASGRLAGRGSSPVRESPGLPCRSLPRCRNRGTCRRSRTRSCDGGAPWTCWTC